MDRRWIGTVWLAAGLLAAWALPAAADERGKEPPGTWLASLAREEAATGLAGALAAAKREIEKPIPLSLSLDYTLVTDYIFRGVNFSEYAGEGREKLNHQLGAAAAWETGKLGTFGVTFWLEWYADQEHITRNSNDHLQEVDYTAYWSYAVEPLATTVETGWIAYTFPQASGDCFCTNEWYVMLSLDDAKLFGTENNVLNPYAAFYMDLDLFHPGCWLELGFAHDFCLAEMGCAETPVLKDLTITPSMVLGYDHRYLNKALAAGHDASKLGNIQYGLAVTYDLASALKLPAQIGGLTLTGFLKFSDAMREELINDELWGGMTIAWQW